MMITLTPQAVRLLCAEAMMPEGTVRKAYKHPSRVKPSTLERLRKAAATLALQPPPWASSDQPR